MNIRPATSKDKPAMIELLRKSLGESTIPKSEALWNWKHEENPFGSSYVLLAEENDELIGLRAFMQWEWQWNNKTYKTIRAVDTATHPQHQGKGIFKKLTLEQLERCKKDDIKFVFNTPNTQSMPGYLKMGWKVQGKMPLKIKVLSPVSTAFRVLFKKKPAGSNQPDVNRNLSSASEWQQTLLHLSKLSPVTVDGLHTPWSVSYIQWRYATNPLFPYSFVSDNKNYILIYRIKEHSRFLELRITDIFIFSKTADLKTEISRQVSKIARTHKAVLLTLSGRELLVYQAYLPSFGPVPVRNAGPAITLRNVTADAEFDSLMNMNNWSYSMGDLELF